MSKKSNADSRANQLNPENEAYSKSREQEKSNTDNRANQLNPKNEAYSKSRSESKK